MCRQNHGVAVDYFAVGVMAFECMFGRVSYFKSYLFRDHTLASPEKKLEITSCQNRSKSRELISQKVGLLKLQISSIK
jgi:hypothetical protein